MRATALLHARGCTGVSNRTVTSWSARTLWERRGRKQRGGLADERERGKAGATGEKIKLCSEHSCSNSSQMKCSACETAWYCSLACQKNHWRHGHKIQCKVFVEEKRKEALLFSARNRDGCGSGDGGGSASAFGGGGGNGRVTGRMSHRIAQPLFIGCHVQIDGIKSKPELNGTKGVVKEEAAGETANRWHVKLDETSAVISLSENSLILIAAPTTSIDRESDGQACFICLDSDGEMVPLGCGCRGSAGCAHIACMSEVAVHADLETWIMCSLCHQHYSGKMHMGLAEERVRRAQRLPETDVESVAAHADLAGALLDNGKYSEAEAIYRKLLDYCRSDHPDAVMAVSTCTHQLAGCLSEQMKYGEVVKLHQSNLRLRQRVLGIDHRRTLVTKAELASALGLNGQVEEAEQLYRTTLKTMKRNLPKNDLETCQVMNAFATLLLKKSLSNCVDGEAEASILWHHLHHAEAMFREVLAIRVQILGPENPDTLVTKGNLASCLTNQGKNAETLLLVRECYKGRLKLYGPKHPETLRSASQLGDVLTKLGEYTESEAILCETFLSRAEVLGPEHLSTKVTAMLLQKCLASMANGHTTI